MSVDTGILLVRVLFGAAIAAHGAQKLFGWFGGYGFSGTMGFFTGMLHIPALFAFLRSTRDRSERALVILNKDRKNSQLCDLARLGYLFAGANAVEDVSPQARLIPAPGMRICSLEPSGVGVLVARFS